MVQKLQADLSPALLRQASLWLVLVYGLLSLQRFYHFGIRYVRKAAQEENINNEIIYGDFASIFLFLTKGLVKPSTRMATRRLIKT